LSDRITGVRGMHDALPEAAARWSRMEGIVRNVVERYGYQEIRLPVLERTELFERSIGDATDIVSKEMYTFTDRNDERLTLRPEGTAGCVRAVLEHGLLNAAPLRLWYIGPMFRYERPQKGRFRQFHQVGVEAFGLPGPDIDAELILLTARLWRELGLQNLRLELNSLGSPAARAAYRAVLVDYFRSRKDRLDADSRERLERNPLRILDSKNPAMQALIDEAPTLTAHLDETSAHHFAGLKEILSGAGVEFTVNPRLVRGLDYYSGTVFEWLSADLGAQAAVCAGGRYDGLVEHFGGKPTPAAGFAMGLERILDLLPEDAATGGALRPHAYLVAAGEALARAMQIAERLRDELPGLRLVLHCGGGSFKSQFRRADRSGAEFALVLGEEELASGSIGIKPLRGDAEQVRVPVDRAGAELRRRLGPAI
jgi:histidyl-tRNA synthetase